MATRMTFSIVIYIPNIYINIYKNIAYIHVVKHGCVLSTVATDALVLKHQAISIHSAEQMNSASLRKKYYIYSEQHNKIR